MNKMLVKLFIDNRIVSRLLKKSCTFYDVLVHCINKNFVGKMVTIFTLVVKISCQFPKMFVTFCHCY